MKHSFIFFSSLPLLGMNEPSDLKSGGQNGRKWLGSGEIEAAVSHNSI
jgi:hypothetical protein